ncbi:MAG: M48 family metalloprotease, partial [Planctomycetaceae bacterium]|nr:M48 family metalloprotease [Planctomycetaceae bacterium]
MTQRPTTPITISSIDPPSEKNLPATLPTPVDSITEEPTKITNSSIGQLVMAVWIAGTFGWFVLAFRRIFRFRALLRIATPASSELQSEAEKLAKQIGVRNCPPVGVVDGPISPMLWAFGGRAKILFPKELLSRLSDEARETLLLHELAHYRRSDHWVRVLELVVTGLYWWNPIVWWALREIHRSEEECCDGWVISQCPAKAPVYARALLETIGFLTDSRTSIPPIASGVGRVQVLEQRLIGIMTGSIRKTIPTSGRLLVVIVAMAGLPVLPWFHQEKGNAAEPANSATENEITEPESNSNSSQVPHVFPFSSRLVAEPTEFETSSTTMQLVEQEVRCLSISPDGKRMVAGHGRWTTSGLIRLWNLETKQPIATWQRERGISGIAYAPSGKLFAAACWDATVKFYDTETVKEVREIRTAKVARIAFSPDGKTLATATEGSELKLWDVESGRELRSFGGELFRMQTVCFSPDGKYLAAAGGAFNDTRNGRV